MEPIQQYQPSDYAKDAVTMLALALDTQLNTDNSSNDLHDHIGSTQFIGKTVRMHGENIDCSKCIVTFMFKNDMFLNGCRAESNWTTMEIV